MHRPSRPSAPRGLQPGLTSGAGRRLGSVLLGGAVLLGLTVAAAARADEPAYPGRAQLRDLQLNTFNCARDNRADDCDRARLEADGLLDHPRLPGICKDTLWTISQEAVVAPRNSLERRDRLDQAGDDLMRFCPRNPPAPARSGNAPGGSPGGAPAGGFRGGAGR